MSWPCGYCGVRPDVDCEHRKASAEWKPYVQGKPDPEDKYKPKRGDMAGLNMKTRKRYRGGK